VQQIAAEWRAAAGSWSSMQHAAIEDLSAQIGRHQALGMAMRSIPLLGFLLTEGAALAGKMRVRTSEKENSE
jgi:hypothetical protein